MTVTVTNVVAGDSTLESYSEETRVPAFGEQYEVQIETGDDVILADGLSKTMVTARIMDTTTNEVVKKNGLVTFTTTKGDFAQPQVSFDQDGEAALQLTSEVSTSTITAFITATITSVPGATEYEGLVGQGQVRFAPEGEIDDELKMVSMVGASASQADRINVVFSGPVTKADIVKGYTDAAAARTDGYGFLVDGTRAVVDVRNVNEKTLELILNVDNTIPTPELRWNSNTLAFEHYNHVTKAITPSTAATPAKGFLRDNMRHNVSFPKNRGNVIANPYDTGLNTGGVNFILTDISKPWIKGVNVINQMTLEVDFSEALSEDIALDMTTIAGNNLFANFRIDGKRLMQTTGGGPAQPGDKTAATNNNYLLVRDVEVNGYWDGTNAVDERNIVTISIDPWNKMAPGDYSIQASNIGDWAAMTHAANMLETQTFDFTVIGDTAIPKVILEEHSPEQWLLTFDRPVKLADLKQLKEAIKIYTKEEYNDANPSAFTMTNGGSGSDHYQVTAIDEDGFAVIGAGNGIAPTATNTTVTDVDRLLIEFTNDWTEHYNTSGTNENYYHSTKSPYVVVVDNFVHDVTENAMVKTVLTAVTPLDTISPTIDNATDMNEIDATNYDKGDAVFVEMSEPVQLKDSTATVFTTPITESQQQFVGAGVPVPTFEFVKEDLVIPGSIDAVSVPQNDYHFIVEPNARLEPGTWTLIIRSISDDVGNTSSTETREFTVEAGPELESDTEVSWIGFDNGADDYDYVFVKFTKEMKSTGANGVARTTNYSLNNNPLPQGSEVIKGIKDWENNATYGNVTNDWDGVTIKMPKTAWGGTPVSGSAVDFTLVFGVASNFEATDGENLGGRYTVQLRHLKDVAVGDADADFNFEAIYLNTAAKNLVDGEAVAGAEAYDTDTDGEIETIELYDTVGNLLSEAGESIYVNGVKFDENAGVYEATTPLKTTDSRGFKITSANGDIIINTGNVIDLAEAVLIKAKGSDGSKEVVLTFSEKVIGSVGADNEFNETYFSFTANAATGPASSVDSVETHNTPLTTITIILDAKLDSTNIGESEIDLAAGLLTSIEDLAETPNNAASNPVEIK